VCANVVFVSYVFCPLLNTCQYKLPPKYVWRQRIRINLDDNGGFEIRLNGFCEGKIFIINRLDGWLRLDIGVTGSFTIVQNY
jgi:hypothetical protein